MLRIALAQLNLLVGDVPGNARRMVGSLAAAREAGAQLVLFQELAVCGYPPEDLLFHAGLREQVGEALAELRAATSGVTAVIGFPEYDRGKIYNAAAVFANGAEIGRYRTMLEAGDFHGIVGRSAPMWRTGTSNVIAQIFWHRQGGRSRVRSGIRHVAYP